MSNLQTMKADLRNPNKVYNRLKYLFDTATPEQVEAGSIWYDEAREYATGLAIKHGYTVSTVCAVLSALSPAVSWNVNKRDAHTLLGLAAVGETEPDNIPASTYGPQVEKALRIAWTGNPDLIGNGLKTVSFYLNMVGIQDGSVCTIDRHILGAATGSRDATHKDISVTSKRYFDVSAQIKRLARNRNLQPKQVQAVIWLTYRERIGLN
jgi:hypothetical protein